MTDIHPDYNTELMSIIAHDLKTPVSAVRGFLELIPQLGALNEGQMRYLDRAHMALDRMERMISSLLEFARLESGVRRLQHTDVDLVEMTHACADFVIEIAHKRGIKIHLPSDDKPIHIPADMDLLGHVITNLLTNAVKYNRDGGEVWVTVSKTATEARVDIRDTGIGIAPKDQLHVFDRFFRVNSKDKSIEGTGLGLAICKTIIDLHGGRIWVSSELGVGSTFSFVLPLKVGSKQPQYHWSHDREGAGEISDDVDDNLQERAEKLDGDSTHDGI
jgi:signal transduction histidine kinase